MLKVLIADDEPYVREGMKHIISWEEIGFEICGEGIDGDDTYNKLIDLNPDLVLIDIKMPGKLGLDVIKESIENGFKGKFVIISGYSDFQYAKVAIKYGVKSYLLKPIDEDELYEIINDLKQEIDEEKNKIKKNQIQNEWVKEHSLEQLILGGTIENDDELVKSLNYSNYRVSLVVKYDDRTESLIELETYLRNRISNINDIKLCKVHNKVALLFCDSHDKRVLSILTSLKDGISKFFGGTVFITLGDQVESLTKIFLSYHRAKDLMKLKFLFLDDEILSNFKLKEFTERKFSFDEIEVLDRIHSYVEIGENNKVKELLHELKCLIQSKLYSEEQVKVLITNNCLEFYDKIKNDYEIDKDIIVDNEEIIKEIYNADSLSNIIEVLFKGFSEMARMISFNSSDKSIKRIVKYIEKNYYTDLKLEFLSEIFNYNSAYLGKVFKNYTGMSFNTYLDTIRINQAKTLLMEDKIKVYQVCERVGYKNIDYFHSKFKKYVGVSPLNYKKQIEGEKEKKSV